MESIPQIVAQAQVANSAVTVGGALAKPRTASTSQTGGSSGGSSATGDATITANDFLTLLVAEMKNQDPTQPTDPNEYISQMVNVNSLQQLIGINQGVGSLDTAAGVTTGTSGNATSGTNSSSHV